jgi:hypothetical protein
MHEALIMDRYGGRGRAGVTHTHHKWSIAVVRERGNQGKSGVIDKICC